ncbi:hypothetical protein NLJ89_g9146 [Agrocybe chaxingu]|uniref:Malic enzyme n=1 Tax=Agrocybe chaxingu TaxID=84603 RepID=A0A9W8K0I4_9AGAR|nr:hypothetical protein NLJ89_g9146 [Agrocybe chaxingu]
MALNAHKPAHLVGPLRVSLRGHPLLDSPRYNKGTAFPISERKAFGLEGRLPYRVNSLEEQCERAYGQLNQRDTAIRKNTFLQSLKDQNWTLYYGLLARHLKELVPVIYTPTQAEAIINYSELFRRSEGLYLTFPDQDRMEEDFLEQTRGRDIDLFVCTDSEAILGIGDQGVGGIGISTAKSVMYTLVGGLDPSKSIPVVLDVGTDNKTLLNDHLYVGWPANRIRGEEYDKFIDRFVQLVRKYYPHSLLHFEDFGTQNAHRLLDKYRETHAVFNDDIQGTGAVTLACIMAAVSVSRRSRAAFKASSSSTNPQTISKVRLADQRFVILGAGSAGMGIATQIRDAMVAADGISRAEANARFWLVDKEGLLFERKDAQAYLQAMDARRREFVRSEEEQWDLVGLAQDAQDETIEWEGVDPHMKKGAAILQTQAPGKLDRDIEWEGINPNLQATASPSSPLLRNPGDPVTLLHVVKEVRPTVLIGCSTASGAFNKEVVQAMLAGTEEGARPIILALSNPTRLAEAVPEDLMHWTEGRALVATGSPFPPVRMNVGGKDIEFNIASCNNALIYPGLGFGAILAQSKRITDTMLIAGAKRLAALSPAISESNVQDQVSVSEPYEYTGESLLPDFSIAPGVNFEVGVAVAEQAVREGSASVGWGVKEGQDVEEKVKEVRERAGEKVWVPVYPEYVFAEDGLKDL